MHDDMGRILEWLKQDAAQRLRNGERREGRSPLESVAITQADGDPGYLSDAEWDAFLRNEFRRELLEDFRV